MFPVRESCAYAWVALLCGCPPQHVNVYHHNSPEKVQAPAKAEAEPRQIRRPRYSGPWEYGTAKSHAELMAQQRKYFFPKDLPRGTYWGVGVASTKEGAFHACAEPPAHYAFVEGDAAFDEATGRWYACVIFSR